MELDATNIKLKVKMQMLLDSFNIPLSAVWRPDPEAKCHGEIANSCIIIYDVDEREVWDTFIHEIIEEKLKEVTNVY
ncbi:MAG: hypothetical protein ABSF65_06700 [Candidatus Bathyarchaeia archaeon]